ncbi:leucyl/phenylalanyl-tRNA--protein transferase [Epibacterium sp. SM1969]|uniref:Leucyl/phenylalanyl-tRNA--protein transferase n=1 Tax=Tritonibacter aquimaris TaxID=2663379 RepID=A0A844AQ81_9RHOB|nr:leucyl/phenylalanyl-tRNA--protein transferase [Tritonibacter aquimaris]MQY43013.1 leucyl/phenylalanyl-tRNA--protein transferase [Tritonibacter aquimaris]
MELSADLLLHAYSIGIFPMADDRDDPEVFWVDPKRRGVFPLNQFHMSRSLARTIRRQTFDVTHNRDFANVVEGCADRPQTWINDEIFSRYNELHGRGHAHSIEIWQDQELVGGVYGVSLGGAFFGESMFSRRTDASKVALAYLMCHLQNCGFTLCDTQFLTPHLASLGAVEISRAKYQSLLKEALYVDAEFTAQPLPAAQDVLQRKTQTS